MKYEVADQIWNDLMDIVNDTPGKDPVTERVLSIVETAALKIAEIRDTEATVSE